MKLNPVALALTAGVLWGASVFLATMWLLLSGSEGQTISKLGVFYLGYTYSYSGAIVGLIWGFIDGLICGGIFALLYNFFLPEKA